MDDVKRLGEENKKLKNERDRGQGQQDFGQDSSASKLR
jgi:hypothetical protein